MLFHEELANHKFIVLCKDHYNPLGLVRSLGECGVRPIVYCASERPSLVKASRYVGEFIRVDSAQQGLDMIIDRFGGEESTPFLLTSDDDSESVVDANFDRLIGRFHFFHGRKGGDVVHFMDKDNISRAAAKVGFRIPRAEVHNRGEMPRDIPYPIITKSIMSIVGGWKDDVFICRSDEELREAYKKIQAPRLLIEEYIEKKNEFCAEGLSINSGAEIFMPFQITYNRFSEKAFGYYTKVEPFADENLREKIRRLIAETGYSGVFEIEFLIDKNDELVFLEINFRNSGWSYSASYGGGCLPTNWARWTLAGGIDTSDLTLRQTPFMGMHEPSDFKENVLSRKVGLLKWLWQFHKCECTYYFNWKDNMPIVNSLFSKIFHR